MSKLIKDTAQVFAKPSIWVKFAKLAIDIKAANLGQGFPDWSPPEFYLESLKKHSCDPTTNHQYTRAFGSIKLVNSIAKSYTKYHKRELTHENILVQLGGTAGLYNGITAFLNPGDELVVIEPFYDAYLPIARISGAKVRGVPLIPPKLRNPKEYLNLFKEGTKIKANFKDEWKFDFEAFSNTLNEKTKMIVLNSPNNPTGKIYSYEEYKEMASIIIKRSPNAIVLSDEVYEHIYFDNHQEFPRIANVDGMWNRTITLSSGGKIFSATGARIGWFVGNADLINSIFSIHQYTTFCMNDILQNTIADCLEAADQPFRGHDSYYEWYRNNYNRHRGYLLNSFLTKTKIFESEHYKAKFWLPEGSYFLIGDISDAKVSRLHSLEGDQNIEYTKGMMYSVNLAKEKRVATIPCSVFYTPENVAKGSNFVRFAFCKQEKTIDSSISNMNQN